MRVRGVNRLHTSEMFVKIFFDTNVLVYNVKHFKEIEGLNPLSPPQILATILPFIK
jgi:hypothetical protein